MEVDEKLIQINVYIGECIQCADTANTVVHIHVKPAVNKKKKKSTRYKKLMLYIAKYRLMMGLFLVFKVIWSSFIRIRFIIKCICFFLSSYFTLLYFL